MIDHLASLRPLPAFIACGLTASVYFRAEIDAPRPVETSSYCGEIDTSVEVFAVTCPDFPTFRGAENRGPRATTTAPTAIQVRSWVGAPGEPGVGDGSARGSQNKPLAALQERPKKTVRPGPVSAV